MTGAAEGTASPGRNNSLAVRRALGLLDVVAQAPEPVSLAEVARLAQMNKSTALRLLSTLRDLRYIQQDGASGRYRLGIKVLNLGQRYLAGLDLREVAAPYLRQLAEATQETVHLVVIDFPDVVYVDKVDSPRAVRMFSTIGARMPAYCTAVGKAALATAADALVDQVVANGLPQRTPKTITTGAQLRADLATVRTRGYAIDDEENEQEIRCVAAVIRDHSGEVAAAISVSAPAARVPDSVISERGALVCATADAISHQLGATAGRQQAGRLATAD